MQETFYHIIDYQDTHQPFFEKVNRRWIEKYFWMEPPDEFILKKPREALLREGGGILLIMYNNLPAGTAALKKINQSDYELTKMAVDDKFQGKGLGMELCKAAIEKVRSWGGKRIILYSNTILKPAIQLYKQLGFTEVPLERGTYARSNIKMELWLTNFSIICGELDQADAIASIGRESFHDAFRQFFNKKEDLDLYLDRTYDVEKIKVSMAKPNNIFFLAYKQETPIGFAKVKKQSLHPKLSGERHMELQKIYLRTACQGLGAGTSLIKSVINFATELKPAYLWLDVFIGNVNAIRLYEKSGFAKFGKHFFKIGSQVFEYDVMALPSASNPCDRLTSDQNAGVGNF